MTTDSPENTPPKAPVRKRLRTRYIRYPDGSLRPVRAQSFAKGDRDQAFSDFFGIAPELPTGSNLRRIESILGEISSRYEIVEEGIAPEILAAAWHEAMGDYIATQAQLVSIRNAQASIRCLHPALRFELNKQKKNIIALLNKRFGDGAVKRIRLMHG